MEPTRQGRRREIAAAVAVSSAALVGGAGATAPHALRCTEATLVGPTFGYALCDGRAFVTRDGRVFRDVTPRLPRVGRPAHLIPVVHDAIFVDRLHGWVVANECSAARAFVFRTTDGGVTWRRAGVRPTKCAAGSRLELFFLDRRRGWLTRIYFNAPGHELERTGDGGASWTSVTTGSYWVGSVSFRTERDAWLGRAVYPDGGLLLSSHDGGRSWRRRGVVLPRRWRGARAWPDLPRFFGPRGVLPVDLERGRRAAVAFYVTADHGRTWRVRAVQTVSKRAGGVYFRYVPVAVASPTEWWFATGRRTLRVTSDAGHRWTVRRLAAEADAISAVSGRRAWVTPETGLLMTADGGRTWRRATLP